MNRRRGEEKDIRGRRREREGEGRREGRKGRENLFVKTKS
jgi:hypothetical protein